MIVFKPQVSPEKIHCRCPSCDYARYIASVRRMTLGLDRKRLEELFFKAVKEASDEKARA